MCHTQRAAIIALPVAGTSGHARADTYAPQNVMVPAYWYPTYSDYDVLSSWDNNNASRGIKTVVVNLGCEANGAWDTNTNTCQAQQGSSHGPVAGGPGSEHDPNYQMKREELASKIQQYRQEGILVYGYVDFYLNRPEVDIDADIWDWTYNYYSWCYPNCGTQWLDGIFFDDAQRTNSDYTQGAQARAEYFAGRAYQRLPWNGNVMFNYGVTSPLIGDLVSCLANYVYTQPGGWNPHQMFNYFVTQETWSSTYLSMDYNTDFGPGGNSAWMNGYNPGHFVNIVHNVPPDADESYVDSLIQQSRMYNAGQLYVTNYMNCKPGNPDPNCATICPPGASPPNPLCHAYGDLAQNSVMNPGTSPIFDYLYTDAATQGNAWYPFGGDSDPSPGSCPPPNAFAQEQ